MVNDGFGMGVDEEDSIVWPDPELLVIPENDVTGQLFLYRENLTDLLSDGLCPGSDRAREVAEALMKIMRDEGIIAPLRFVADGEGGYVFEFVDNSCSVNVNVDDVGRISIDVFENNKLLGRFPSLLPSDFKREIVQLLGNEHQG